MKEKKLVFKVEVVKGVPTFKNYKLKLQKNENAI